MSQERLSFQLSAKNYVRLMRLASQHRCLYQGEPSWRVLIRRLAAGELQIATPPDHVPPVATQDEITQAVAELFQRKAL